MTSREEPAGLALRLIAARRLRDVLGGAAFQPFLPGEVPDSRNRALANRLVTTVLRRQGHLDLIIGDLLERGVPKKSGSFEAVLRLSLTQLLFMPDLGAHSAIFLAVEAIKRDEKARHLTGLLNAVLRRAQGSAARYWDMPPDLLVPPWLRRRWAECYGPELVSVFGEALLETPPLDLTVPHADALLIEALGGYEVLGNTVRIGDRDRPVNALPGYDEGRWWVQDAAAAIPARLVRLDAGARVLDLCAAPGGKTAQLASAGYAVTALDNDALRLDRLRANLERLQLAADVIEADATTGLPQGFDGVLLDAPCSSTGTFRRHPEVLAHRGAADIAARAALQRRLVSAAAAALRPGGTLIYAVCSLQPEEGEDIARWAADATVQLAPDPVSADELPGLHEAVTPEGFVRTHPGMLADRGRLDGFFIARFRRIS